MRLFQAPGSNYLLRFGMWIRRAHKSLPTSLHYLIPEPSKRCLPGAVDPELVPQKNGCQHLFD